MYETLEVDFGTVWFQNPTSLTEMLVPIFKITIQNFN